jgi:hypothetical protein
MEYAYNLGSNVVAGLFYILEVISFNEIYHFWTIEIEDLVISL